MDMTQLAGMLGKGGKGDMAPAGGDPTEAITKALTKLGIPPEMIPQILDVFAPYMEGAASEASESTPGSDQPPSGVTGGSF
jgi:hypothetical protein